MLRRIFKGKTKITLTHPGFSLVELIVYIGLFVAVVGLITQLTGQLLTVLRTTEATEAVIGSTRNAMDVIAQEIRHSNSVYTPTSLFAAANGQLSLETSRDMPDGETATYVDIYLDSGALYLKREGETAERITAAGVTVTQFELTHLNELSIPAVRVSVVATAGSGTTGAMRPFSLTSTVALRSYD